MLLLKTLTDIEWVLIIGWLIIFIITLIIELETADLTTIWFCISALITLICGVTFAGPFLQIGIFFGLSIILLIATRPIVKRMKTSIIKTNTDRLVGMIATVTKDITPNEIGEVKVENNLWRAINNEGLTFTVGEKVSIDAIVGIKLVVSKTSGNSNIEIIHN